MRQNFETYDDCRTMAAVRSSPRLRALLYSNPSGKPAVFSPRVNRVNTSDRILRSKNTKKRPLKDSETSSPSELSHEKKFGEKRLRVSKIRSDGTKSRGGASENVLEGERCPLDSSKKKQQSLTTGTKTQTASKRSKRVKMLGHDEEKCIEVSTRCKQRKSSRVLASSANNPPSLEHCVDSVTNSTTDVSTGMSIRRKRGRPPKNTVNCKRVKVSAIADRSEVNTDKSKVVIDLTCEDETLGDEDFDAMITTPPSFTSPDLTQATNADALALVHSSEASKDKHDGEDIDGGCGTNIAATDAESDYLTTSLDPDETIAQLFDLGVTEDQSSMNDSSETVTIPSLKRSKNINPLVAELDVASSEQALEIENSNGDTPDTLNSPTEEEYPQPSTHQQKLIRRLARQKQLEEMRAREAAHSREERLLRRKGVLPDTKATQSSAKRISWRDETDLVEMFIYSPVREDDDDTVSVHSDDALNMDLTLSAT